MTKFIRIQAIKTEGLVNIVLNTAYIINIEEYLTPKKILWNDEHIPFTYARTKLNLSNSDSIYTALSIPELAENCGL